MSSGRQHYIGGLVRGLRIAAVGGSREGEKKHDMTWHGVSSRYVDKTHKREANHGSIHNRPALKWRHTHRTRITHIYHLPTTYKQASTTKLQKMYQAEPL